MHAGTVSLLAACTVRYVVRTTRILRVLNKFCARSEQIIQSISNISWDYSGYKVFFFYSWNVKTNILKTMKKYILHYLFTGLLE